MTQITDFALRETAISRFWLRRDLVGCIDDVPMGAAFMWVLFGNQSFALTDDQP